MWNDTDTPLAYFITFRTCGTWLHGDERGSIDRYHNQYRSPYIAPGQNWHRYNHERLRVTPLILDSKQRKSVETAIRETCVFRKWGLLALNVRTNHVHIVVSANRDSELVLNALKANATRQLRQDGLWTHGFSPWARKGSKRNLCGPNAALLEQSTMCFMGKATIYLILMIDKCRGRPDATALRY